MKTNIIRTIHLTNLVSCTFAGLLKQRLADLIPSKQAQLSEIKKKYGNEVIGQITVAQAIGGMRGVKSLFYDASLLDPQSGITFREYNIPDVQEYLHKAEGGNEPLPESLYWLLMTGEFPSTQEFLDLQNEFKERSEINEETIQFVRGLPKDAHPMTMLSQCLLNFQKDSIFSKLYYQGRISKSSYWEYFYEDSLNLLAKIPSIAALIYRHKYKNGNFIQQDTSLDWAGNYAHMLGYDQHEVKELLRGYLSIHRYKKVLITYFLSDHEGGNVSAHACHLVGSALSDPYLAYSTAINGLAGPLHGLANQEVLKWVLELKNELGENVTEEKIKEYVLQTIAEGKVVPGYGHAVLRHTDPRFLHLKAFADKYIQKDPLVELVGKCFHAIPPTLKSIAKIQNPWPNVDAHSGVLLYHYGMTEFQYYTVVFAVSRALGCMANLVWSRAFGLPIERPGSITLRWIQEKYGK